MSPSASLLIMGAVAIVLAVGGLAMSAALSPNRKSRTKLATYECGIAPNVHEDARGRFPIKYYLIAMTFIVFDVEMVFLYPFAVSIGHFGQVMAIPVLIDILLFIVLVLVPYIYEWRRGGLDY